MYNSNEDTATGMQPQELNSVPSESSSHFVDHHIAFRALDANFNRAMEAFRTLEDIARFDDLSSFQASYKQLRHELQTATGSWDRSLLLAARDAGGDVGREVKTECEGDRSQGSIAIANAAAQRLQQSLRCLEEFSKLAFPASAQGIEQIRYRVYDVNAPFLLAIERDLTFLRQAQLYLLVDCQLPLDTFAIRMRELSRAGVDIVQIRDKSKEGGELIAYTRAAIDAVESSATRIIVNDRIDVARAARAWGVHVGQSDVPVRDARALMAPRQVLGFSTHTLDQIDRAITMGVDYIGCGPTFPSMTKQFATFAGLPFLAAAAKRLANESLAPFAIGGITLENLGQVIEAGFRRVAVSSSIWNASDPGEVASQIKYLLRQQS